MISDNAGGVNNHPIESNGHPASPGGAPSALDMNDPADRGALRRAHRQWPARCRGIDEKRRQGWLDDLGNVRDVARKHVLNPLCDIPEDSIIEFDPSASQRAWCGTLVDAIKTEVKIDEVAQKDEHHESEMSNPREHTEQHIHMHEAAATDPKLADAIDVLAAAVRNSKTLPG